VDTRGPSALPGKALRGFSYPTSRFAPDLGRRGSGHEMNLLRGVLKVQAALWAIAGLALGLVPIRVMDALGQLRVPESAWLRMLGITSFVLAMLMWLLATSLDKVWWWAWAFALLEAGIATMAIVNVAFGLNPGVEAWPWWAMGAIAAAFAVLDMIGLARTSQEKPQV
jgi:hypothetical protein